MEAKDNENRAIDSAADSDSQQGAAAPAADDDGGADPRKRQTLKIIGAGLLGAVAVGMGLHKWKEAHTEPPVMPGDMRGPGGGPAVAPPNPAAGVEPGSMTYRVSSRTGERVSMLGFGCMRFPTLPDPYNPGRKIIDEEASYKLVDYAWSHGVNYFDTAHFYHDGNSETFIGAALSRYPRDSYFLADKMPSPLDPSLEDAKMIFEGQLAKCKVDYFDNYLLHNLSNFERDKSVYIDRGVLAYLLEQKKEGRIRHLGWSFHGDRQIFDWALSLYDEWDFVQIQLNYNDWVYGDTKRSPNPLTGQWMYEKLTSCGIPVVIMEPLLGGRLANISSTALRALQAINPSASAASWAMRWFEHLPNVLTVLSGMTYMEHLQENVATFSPLQPLNEAENKALDKALEVFQNGDSIPCTGCNYCMPCPYGVDIPAVFSVYNKCVTQNRIPSDRGRRDYQRLRREFLIDYGRAVAPMRQAERCISCGKCVPACPQKIGIPMEMMRVSKLVESLK